MHAVQFMSTAVVVTFIIYLLNTLTLYFIRNTFKILPRHGYIWINRIFTLAMEKKLRENARWNVNKTIRCLVRNEIKHRKNYKIGKSPTPLDKISIVL